METRLKSYGADYGEESVTQKQRLLAGESPTGGSTIAMQLCCRSVDTVDGGDPLLVRRVAPRQVTTDNRPTAAMAIAVPDSTGNAATTLRVTKQGNSFAHVDGVRR
jgi:hypothetical protein